MRRPRWGRRPSGWFLVATVLAAAAALATLRAAATGGPTVQVLVAAHDLDVGSRPADPAAVVSVTIPSQAALPGMLRALDEVGGRIVAVPVAAGEPITEGVLGGRPGAPVPPLRVGERAVSVPLSSAGAAAPLLVPGVAVDVVGVPALDAGPPRVLVAGARVIAQTAPPGADAGATESGALLLRVAERDALTLAAALDAGGGIRLLARPLGEGGAP